MLTKSLVEINTVVNNSTGRIMHDIQREADISGMETLSIVGRRHVYTDVPCLKYGNAVSFWIHVIWTSLTDRHGLEPVLSVIYTRKMVRRIREANPDIIHLHNIHGYYLHYPTLMKYLAYEYKGKIIWTFHDLWPITGHCPHYIAVNCKKWMTGCNHCPNKKRYPVSLGLDGSRKNYEKKKELFTSLSNLTITVPSEWMASQVRQSFMGKYPVEVIHNGIDTAVFDHNRLAVDSYTESSRCVGKISWSDKKILLSVASIWDERKGLKDLVALSDKLSDDYLMVIVGLSKHQISRLPKGVIGIARTENIEELVSLYSRAHIFINPSLEESFSLVTVEALSCGCPCIVLDTSAVAELVNDDNGVVLHSHKPEDYLDAIKSIENRGYTRESVRATALKYDNKYMLEGYMRLYGEVLRDES
ncbi:MAG: glycosyltransferase [Lachnospiraceae bacterium]|nr:glycosyltransferase [Lachnospiraceae bacterium]